MRLNALRHPVLVYDGVCGFCDGAVQFILARDRRRTLQFAAVQGEFADQVFKLHPELRRVDSLLLVQPASAAGQPVVLTRTAAVIGVALYLGGVWALCGHLVRLLPRPVRDMGYDAFARARFRVFGRREACRVPSTETRTRFLD